MLKIFKDVEEFHRKMDYPIGDRPAVPPVPVRVNRVRLIAEEVQEFLDEIGAGEQHLDKIAQEGVDTIYTVLGALAEYGIDPTDVWTVVHRANMLKQSNPKGKATKPVGWQRPQVDPIIEGQIRSRWRFRFRSVWGFTAYPRGFHVGPFEFIWRTKCTTQ